MRHIGEVSWRVELVGEVDSSFGLHRSQASPSFKMLEQQKLEEVEVPHVKALFSPTISLPSIKSCVGEEVDVV
jgi:hypothetical protein